MRSRRCSNLYPAGPKSRQVNLYGDPVWSKIKTVGKTGVIPSRRSLAACRPLHFFGAIKGALADRRANGGRRMEWARILAYITGTVDHELLLRNEYLAAENRILRGQLK